MLKISITGEPAAKAFLLEGKLAGPWVRELDQCWRAEAGDGTARGLRVDLTGVTFIDAPGKDLLARMHRDGAAFVAADCMTRAIVEDITAGCESPVFTGHRPRSPANAS